MNVHRLNGGVTAPPQIVRLPPPNPALDLAERSVLGSCLLDGEAMGEAMGAGLERESFWAERHRILWGVMEELVRGGALDGAGGGLDVPVLAVALIERGLLGAGGGLAYLSSLTSELGTAANALYWARKVVREAKRRAARAAVGEALGELEGEEDLVGWAGRLGAAVGEATVPAEGTGKAVREVVREVQRRLEDAEGGAGRANDRYFETGIEALDEMLGGGVRGGDLSLVIAPPGMGKSSLCRHLALQAAQQGWEVEYHATEETEQQVAEAMAAALGRYSPSRLWRTLEGRLVAGEEPINWEAVMEAYNVVKRLPIRLAHGQATAARLMGTVAASSRKRLHVVDYLQDLDFRAIQRGEIYSDVVLEALRGFARAAQKSGAALILAAQPSRTPFAERRAAESGEIGECPRGDRPANLVLTLHRPERWDSERDARELQIHVKKNKGRAVGEVLAKWTPHCMRIDDPQGWQPRQQPQPKPKGGRT